jgi:hypothetical protein
MTREAKITANMGEGRSVARVLLVYTINVIPVAVLVK